jgi:hypothetical protein
MTRQPSESASPIVSTPMGTDREHRVEESQARFRRGGFCPVSGRNAPILYGTIAVPFWIKEQLNGRVYHSL